MLTQFPFAQVLPIIFLLSSLLQVVFSGDNNIPSPNLKEVYNCTEYPNEVCDITFVVIPLLSMTYYNMTNYTKINHVKLNLRGYRAYYDGFELNLLDDSNDRSKLRKPITVDGEFRSIITVNYQMPGPTIIANKNQTLNINVYNELPNGEGISIHWHGMHQKDTPEMDGVAHITQEPIPTYQNFTYRFKASPAGTHWYHAHSGAHRTEGLYGALIVKDTYPDDHELYDEDLPEQHTLLLMDWQQEPSMDLFYQIRNNMTLIKTTCSCTAQRYTSNPSYCYIDTLKPIEGNKTYRGIEPKSIDGTQVGPIPFWSGIINDKGRHYDEHGKHNGADLNVFTVTSGRRYRFRLIGAQALYAYKFSIQDHLLTVIATDGSRIKSIKDVHYVIINSGERYDIVVNASQTPGNYWILAETLENPINSTGFHSHVHFHRAEAVLHYDKKTVKDPKELYQTNDHSRTWDNTCIRNYVNCPFLTKEQPKSANQTRLPASSTMNCINVDQFESLSEDNNKCTKSDEIKTLFYNFGFDGEHTTRGSSVDGINFRLPSYSPFTKESYLSDQICSGRGCDHNKIDHCACTQVINITKGECIELVITNYLGDDDTGIESSHPVHLHGHYFDVVKIGYPSYTSADYTPLHRKYNNRNKDVECKSNNSTSGGACKKHFITVKKNETIQEVVWAKNQSSNFESNKTYAEKDTVIVPFGGYTVIRFEADNPGWWFFHCHIEIHQLEGMAALIQEIDPNAVQVVNSPQGK